MGTLPVPTRAGFTFAGWWTAQTGGTQVLATHSVPDSNRTYWARWSVLPPTNVWVPNIRQERTNWCWAAVSVSVLRNRHSNNNSLTQTEFARVATGRNPPPNEMLGVDATAVAIRRFTGGSNAFSHTGGRTVSQVFDDLSRGRPIIAGSNAHLVVVFELNAARIFDLLEDTNEWHIMLYLDDVPVMIHDIRDLGDGNFEWTGGMDLNENDGFHSGYEYFRERFPHGEVRVFRNGSFGRHYFINADASAG
ncbi:MAG: InlB B-repeat-containing protein [Oscillospiraceae bacterium]|nr:InlB B-repeat-containing protein [Oscillospiraceae bacterium]